MTFPTISKHISTRSIASHLVMIIICLVTLFPIYWMFLTSVRPPNDVLSASPWTWTPDFTNYKDAWTTVPMGRMLINTFVMAALITISQLITSLLAAYAFARWNFFGERVLFILFTATWLVPLQVTMIPNYVLLANLGWLNTLAALIVPQVSSAFAIILLRQYLKGFPKELIDAARMDGASSWRILWGVIVPNLRAPLAALMILLFISSWNEYFWPLLVTRRIEDSVIQVGLQMFMTQEGNQWGPLMAAASIASLPIFILYVLLQRQVIDAFVRSGLK